MFGLVINPVPTLCELPIHDFLNIAIIFFSVQILETRGVCESAIKKSGTTVEMKANDRRPHLTISMYKSVTTE